MSNVHSKSGSGAPPRREDGRGRRLLVASAGRRSSIGDPRLADADRVEKAVEAVLADGVRTADLLGEEGVSPVSTQEMGDAIVAKLAASV